MNIFRRCGLKALPVEADTGVMGGSHSHEFMVPAEVGEDDIVFNSSGTYAANIEKAKSGLKSPFPTSVDPASQPAVEKFETPGVKTIQALEAAPYGVPADKQIKTLVYIVNDEPILILLLGSDQLNEAKLTAALGTGTFRAATADEVFQTLNAHPGSLGALDVSGPKIYADKLLQNGHDLTTGANEDGFHVRNVCVDRDIKVTEWADLRTVKEGEPCPENGEPLQNRAAIEVGHVFKL